MDLKAPRGTRDILPVETPAWQYVEQSFSSVCDRFSFQEIRVPTLNKQNFFKEVSEIRLI